MLQSSSYRKLLRIHKVKQRPKFGLSTSRGKRFALKIRRAGSLPECSPKMKCKYASDPNLLGIVLGTKKSNSTPLCSFVLGSASGSGEVLVVLVTEGGDKGSSGARQSAIVSTLTASWTSLCSSIGNGHVSM